MNNGHQNQAKLQMPGTWHVCCAHRRTGTGPAEGLTGGWKPLPLRMEPSPHLLYSLYLHTLTAFLIIMYVLSLRKSNRKWERTGKLYTILGKIISLPGPCDCISFKGRVAGEHPWDASCPTGWLKGSFCHVHSKQHSPRGRQSQVRSAAALLRSLYRCLLHYTGAATGNWTQAHMHAGSVKTSSRASVQELTELRLQDGTERTQEI